LHYNVAQLLKEPTGSSRHFDLSETVASPEPDWGAELTLTGTVELVRTPDGILLEAHVQTLIPDVCGRCLEPVTEPLDLVVEEEFYPAIDLNTGHAVTQADPDAFVLDQRHVLDLTEAVRQSIWTAREIQPLCRPDCKGLCPTCGANQNTAPCTCAKVATDPRWDRLRRRSA